MAQWHFPANAMAGLGPATVIRADARNLPLADESVDLIVTSPPYFALRSYRDDGEHYDGQVGSEATPQEFVDALIDCTRGMIRVLKPSGSLFVNLGDKYSTGNSGDRNNGFNERWGNTSGVRAQERSQVGTGPARGYPSKTLLDIPWRYSIRCVDELRLIKRAEIVWSKPNGLPESVTDRVRRSHEVWLHFVREPQYFSAVDELREITPPFERRPKSVRHGSLTSSHGSVAHDGNGMRMAEEWNNPLGKLPGSVREVASQPLKVPAHLGIDHFAAFPPSWPSWIIRGWSPAGICVECGEGRRPVTHVDKVPTQQTNNGRDYRRHAQPRQGGPRAPLQMRDVATITGYGCACPTPDAPTRPATVLDPFGGTGTTAMAARALGRHGISVDMSADYCRLARWRVDDPDELAAVRGLPRAKRAEVRMQPSLFDAAGEAS